MTHTTATPTDPALDLPPWMPDCATLQDAIAAAWEAALRRAISALSSSPSSASTATVRCGCAP